MHMSQQIPPAMAERIRLTIAVTPEVHEVFGRMAEASGVSLGRTIGDWLADTMEGAQFVAQKMEEAKSQPRLVMREMQSYLEGTRQELESVVAGMRSPGGTRAAGAPRASIPPVSNTGGKPPGKTTTTPKRGAT